MGVLLLSLAFILCDYVLFGVIWERGVYMLSAIAGVVNAIGKGLKRAEKRIDKVIKKTKVKLQQAESADDKLQTSVQKGKRLGGLATKWQLKTTRLWLKVLEWFLYFLDLLIKLIMLICSSVVGLLVIVAVILIVFIGTLLQQMGSVNDTDFGGISIGEGGEVTNLAGVNWDEALAKAQAMHKTGEFSDEDMCRFQVIYLCYCYAQENPDIRVMPETVIGMSITETGFSCYQDYTGKDAFVDHSDYYQGGAAVYPGKLAIGPLQLDSRGRGYGDGSEVKKIRDIKHTKESHLGSNFNVDTFIPYAVARTFEAVNIEHYLNEENKTDTETEAYYMYKAMKEWGIEETQENIEIIANMWVYSKHWIPSKFSSDGRQLIGGYGVGNSEKWCEITANLICGVFVECGGDWTKWNCELNIADYLSSDWIRKTMAGDIRTTGSFATNSKYKATLDGKALGMTVAEYLVSKYKDNKVLQNAASDAYSFEVDGSNSAGCVPTMTATPFCPIGGRAITVAYLERLGIDPTALQGGATVTGGGSGAFGLEYYNSDGSVNIEALNTASAILGEFCKYENAYVDTITLPSEVSIKDKDGKDKKVKIKGGTYPNFWGMKHNITAATGNWGQCTWFAKGRAMLWLYENVGTDESQWYLGGSSKPMGGNGVAVASSMSGWCTVDSTLGSNSVVSRSGDAYYNKYTGTYYRPGHVAYIEAVDTKNNMYYVSHGNISRCSYQQIRFSGGADNWGNMPSIESVVGDIDSGRGFSYIQEIPIAEAGGGGVVSDAGGYPFVDIAHLDKRK